MPTFFRTVCCNIVLIAELIKNPYAWQILLWNPFFYRTERFYALNIFLRKLTSERQPENYLNTRKNLKKDNRRVTRK